MKVTKTSKHYDEAVTPDVLARAVERGAKGRGPALHATGVQYLADLKALLVEFADHSAIAFPIANYPELAVLGQGELDAMEIGFGGAALCLDSHDLHVSIAGLVSASQPLMALAATVIAARNGGRSSEAKAQAARANGQKGGRPRKLATAG